MTTRKFSRKSFFKLFGLTAGYTALTQKAVASPTESNPQHSPIHKSPALKVRQESRAVVRSDFE